MAGDKYCITCGIDMLKSYDPPIECDGCSVYLQAYNDGYKTALSQMKSIIVERLTTIPYDSRTKRGRQRTGLEATLFMIHKLQNSKPQTNTKTKQKNHGF